jgi:hypothetical protein
VWRRLECGRDGKEIREEGGKEINACKDKGKE